MPTRASAVCTIHLILLAGYALPLHAQTTPAPTAYTVTANNAMFATATTMKTYRLGSKAVVDNQSPAGATGANELHLRTFFDLDTHQSISWDPVNSSAPCTKQTFTGDWGDLFTGGDLVNHGAKQVASETIRGYAARVWEIPAGPSGTMKAWVDSKSSLILKAQMIPPTGPPVTMFEVTDVNLTPPPTSVFAIPARCSAAAAASPPASAAPMRPPGEAEEIAALTGDDGTGYLNGIYGPGSGSSCTMVFRVVRAGTMEPVTTSFQVAADLDVTTEPPPHYDIHMSRDGHTTFAGGGLHEIVSPTRNGVFSINNIPAQFEMDIEFGDHGSATANLYRQCFSPKTVLLYVVKDLSDITKGGDWLWVKAAKYAAVAH
jgi:hypothetical protein